MQISYLPSQAQEHHMPVGMYREVVSSEIKIWTSSFEV